MAENDNVIGCASDLTFLEMLSGAIGEDASGKPYIRLKTTTNVAGSKYFGCGDGGDPTTIEAGLKAIFTLDANGDWAIRTGTA